MTIKCKQTSYVNQSMWLIFSSIMLSERASFKILQTVQFHVLKFQEMKN